MSTASTIFTLFLVTAGADVKHSTYDSLKACQEAKSLALYGKTIEAKKAADDAEAKAKAARDARDRADEADDDAWRKAHPLQAASWWQKQTLKDDTEVKEAEKGSDDRAYFSKLDDNIHHERRPHWKNSPDAGLSGIWLNCNSLVMQDGQPVCVTSPAQIRTAECVIVPEDKP